MVEVTVVIRERGRVKPEYSLKFSLPEIPRVGDYISIFRPDSKVHTEDVVVRHIWWHLHHGETRPVVSTDDEKVGRVVDVMVECDQAIGPYSRDHWRDGLGAAEAAGLKVEHFNVDRFIVREDELK